MTMGTLYSSGHLCPFTHRVLIAVSELNAPVGVVYGDAIPEAVRDQVAAGGWPVFITSDTGELIRESTEIVDYIIDHGEGGSDAYRSDPSTLATLDALIDSIRKVIMAGDPSVQQECRSKLDRSLEEVAAIRSAGGGPFLGGDTFSQSDGHVAPFLHRLPFLFEVRDHVPEILKSDHELMEWVDRVVNRPSFQEIAPRRHMLRQVYADKASYGKPMKIGLLHHAAFRSMWTDLARRTSSIASCEDHDNDGLQEARDLAYLLFRTVTLHATYENQVLFPALEAAAVDPRFTAEATAQHEREERSMNDVLELLDRALAQPPGERGDLLAGLAEQVEHARQRQVDHLDYEEENVLPALAGMSVEQHLGLLEAAFEMCLLERPHLIGVMASYLPLDGILSLVDSLRLVADPGSDVWRQLVSDLHAHLGPEQWLALARRFEDDLPTSLLCLSPGSRRRDLRAAALALDAVAPVDRIEIPPPPVAV